MLRQTGILGCMSTIIGKLKNLGAIDPISDADLMPGQRQIAYADLKGMAEAFNALSGLCTGGEKPVDVSDQLKIELDRRVCCQCPRHVCCFGREELPIDIFGTLYNILTTYGTIYTEDISEELRMICPQSRRLAATANTAYEIIKSRESSQRAIERTRKLLTTEFGVMSKALQLTANRIRATARNRNMEDKLLHKLKSMGLRNFTVSCMEDDAGTQTVEISMRGQGFTKELANIAQRACSLCCNTPMSAEYEGYGFETGGQNRLRLTARNRYMAEVGTTERSVEDICGDSVILAVNRFGHAVFGIADGMGTGSSAAEVSRTVATMCEKAFAMGMDLDDIVAAANGASAILSDGDKYTTLDLLEVNLKTGRAEFSKLCGCPTLLLRRGRIETLSGNGMPVGHMENTPDSGVTTLQHGDTLMMCSDGIWNNLPEDKETALSDILSMPDLNKAADIIAGMCQLSCSSPDDMTVLIIRIWEN